MALIINDTSYSGDKTSYYSLKPLVESSTFKNGLVKVEDFIAKKRTIATLDMTQELFQSRVPTPITSLGDITLSGKVLDPQDVMIYTSFNPRDLESNYASEEQIKETLRLLDRRLPRTIEASVVNLIMNRSNIQLNKNMWMGRLQYGTGTTPASKNAPATDASLKYFDGFIKLALDAANFVPVTYSVVTAANIRAKLQSMVNALPVPLAFATDKVKFVMNSVCARIYLDAQRSDAFKNGNWASKGELFFDGFEIKVENGITDNNTIILSNFSMDSGDANFFYGTNSIGEENNIQLARLQANSELYFCKILFKASVQIGWTENIVMHTGIIA